jgi:DNA-binding NarL/FixJ family response regulator
VLIVLAEDSVLVREGLARLLEEAGHTIIAKVGDAAAVVTAVDRQLPDLLITDIRMPPTMTDDGARAAREVRVRHPGLPILLLSQHVETTHSVELVSTGAFGYLLKDRILDLDDFLAAVTRVAAGGSALDPEVVASLVRPHGRQDPPASLTPRELEVLALVAEGRSNAAIATALWTTSRTVETHVRHIFEKLGLLGSETDHRRVLAVLAYLQAHAGDIGPGLGSDRQR